MLKRILRSMYRTLPLKRSALEVLRRTAVAKAIPHRIRRFLSFSAPFTVRTEEGCFKLWNGYGREIESAIFWEGVSAFEATTIPWWVKLAKRSTYIFDVGANTGVYALIAKTCNANAHIHAFEPLKRIHKILEDNFRINNADASQKGFLGAHQLALSDYSGSGDMFDLPVEHMYTASLNHDVHAERGQAMQSIQESVLVTRLDDFIEKHAIQGIDLIKIDVESHEAAVIRGMGKLLQTYHPTMIVEIWNNEIGMAVEAELDSCNYLYFSLVDAIPVQTHHIRNDFPDIGYINYLICTRTVAAALQLSSKKSS